MVGKGRRSGYLNYSNRVAGSKTSCDGRDDGRDDAALINAVQEAVKTRSSGSQCSSDEDEEIDEEASAEGSAPSITPGDPRPTLTSTNDELSSALPPGSTSTPALMGMVQTRHGTVDPHTAIDLELSNLSDDSEKTDEFATSTGDGMASNESTGTTPSATGAQPATTPTPAASSSQAITSTTIVISSSLSANSTTPSADAISATAVAITPPSGARARKKRPLLPTVASPDGEPLSRDPSKADADELERKTNKKLKVTLARLGGQDLRAVRDNLDKLARTIPSEAALTTGDSTYNKLKRTRANRKLSDLERELPAVVYGNDPAGRNDMLEMLIFFREESDRKVGLEETRHREHREEGEAQEKREREEKELARRDEVAAAESRRHLELEEARLQREERDKDHEEDRRRFEQRIELDRAEARQRHEQMMMLFASLQKK